jgi:hypothetical protein
MHTKKRKLLEALERSLGVVATACTAANISRRTHYNWMREDAQYRAEVESIEDGVLDFVESKLHQLIEQGNVAATIFLLKTKGKRRGYTERQEVEVATPRPLSWLDGGAVGGAGN